MRKISLKKKDEIISKTRPFAILLYFIVYFLLIYKVPDLIGAKEDQKSKDFFNFLHLYLFITISYFVFVFFTFYFSVFMFYFSFAIVNESVKKILINRDFNYLSPPYKQKEEVQKFLKVLSLENFFTYLFIFYFFISKIYLRFLSILECKKDFNYLSPLYRQKKEVEQLFKSLYLERFSNYIELAVIVLFFTLSVLTFFTNKVVYLQFIYIGIILLTNLFIFYSFVTHRDLRFLSILEYNIQENKISKPMSEIIIEGVESYKHSYKTPLFSVFLIFFTGTFIDYIISNHNLFDNGKICLDNICISENVKHIFSYEMENLKPYFSSTVFFFINISIIINDFVIVFSNDFKDLNQESGKRVFSLITTIIIIIHFYIIYNRINTNKRVESIQEKLVNNIGIEKEI